MLSSSSERLREGTSRHAGSSTRLTNPRQRKKAPSSLSPGKQLPPLPKKEQALLMKIPPPNSQLAVLVPTDLLFSHYSLALPCGLVVYYMHNTQKNERHPANFNAHLKKLTFEYAEPQSPLYVTFFFRPVLSVF